MRNWSDESKDNDRRGIRIANCSESKRLEKRTGLQWEREREGVKDGKRKKQKREEWEKEEKKKEDKRQKER